MSQVSEEIKARQNDDGKENENEIPGSPPLNGDAQGANYHPQPTNGGYLPPLWAMDSDIDIPTICPPIPKPQEPTEESSPNSDSSSSDSDSEEYYTADEGSSNDSDGLPEDADGEELVWKGDASCALQAM